MFLYYYYSKQTKVSILSGACISSAAFFESSAKLGILALLWAIVCCALKSALLLWVVAVALNLTNRSDAFLFNALRRDLSAIQCMIRRGSKRIKNESSPLQQRMSSLSLSLKIWKLENLQNSRRFANVSSMQLTDQCPLFSAYVLPCISLHITIEIETRGLLLVSSSTCGTVPTGYRNKRYDWHKLGLESYL